MLLLFRLPLYTFLARRIDLRWLLMFGLALDSLNVMPAAAGAESVRVHTATPGVTKLCGAHATAFKCAGWGMVITAARPWIGTVSPSRDAPSAPVTPMVETASDVPCASCTVTRATTPSPRTPLVSPARMQLSVPAPPAQ